VGVFHEGTFVDLTILQNIASLISLIGLLAGGAELSLRKRYIRFVSVLLIRTTKIRNIGWKILTVLRTIFLVSR